MKIKLKYLLIGVNLLMSATSFALECEHVLWEKIPIRISLSLQEERLIHFPQPIKIIDSEAQNLMAILKIKDALYLKAKSAFSNKRLIVQLMPQGEVVILTLSANENISASKPVEVLLASDEDSTTNKSETPNNFDINAITLTRFAIQSLYSPQRLLIIPEGVSRIPMQTRRQINLIYGASIEARPLISWRGGAFYVTAVELKNLLKKEVVIDPRRMIGNWQTASFYPTNTLAPRGQEDTSTVFLISERPFSEALATGREFVR